MIFITKTIKIELTDKEKLLFACADGDLEEAKRLLSTGQDVNTTDQRGHSLLWLACYRNQPDIVKLLLEQPNIKGDSSILMIPNILSTKSFSINEATSLVIKEQEQDPFWKACYLGEEEKFKELLQSVSDINTKGYNGTTPLIAATINQKHPSFNFFSLILVLMSMLKITKEILFLFSLVKIQTIKMSSM